MNTLRTAMRRRRRLLGPGVQCRAAHRLLRAIIASEWYDDYQHLAFYWPNDGEIDGRPLLYHSWRCHKACYLPVVLSSAGRLLFRRYLPGAPLVCNGFGIPEPGTGMLVEPEALEAVLCPLVAFDRQGHRMGMGGGYYDRSFAFVSETSSPQRPLLVGVAHACQQVPSLTVASWDVPLDKIYVG